MSFIPLPSEDDDGHPARPEDEDVAPLSLESESEDFEPPALPQGSDDPAGSNPIELPLDPALADAVANPEEQNVDAELFESFMPPTIDGVLDASMSFEPRAGDPVAAFEQQSWQDARDRLAKRDHPNDEALPPPRFDNLLGRRDAPHRIERRPLRPDGESRASKIVKLSHQPPYVSETNPSDQQSVLGILPSPSTSAAPHAGDFPLASTPLQQPAARGETKPLGHPRPMALVQLAEYEQFFLAEQDALIDRLTELARRIANEEIDHAAWVDYIHERAILGRH